MQEHGNHIDHIISTNNGVGDYTPTSRNPMTTKNFRQKSSQLRNVCKKQNVCLNKTFIRQNTHSQYQQNLLIDSANSRYTAPSPCLKQKNHSLTKGDSKQRGSRKQLILSEQPKQHFYHIFSKESYSTQASNGILKIKFMRQPNEEPNSQEISRQTQYQQQQQKQISGEYKPVFFDNEEGAMMNTYTNLMNQNPKLKEQLLGNPLFNYLINNQTQQSKNKKKSSIGEEKTIKSQGAMLQGTNSNEQFMSMNSLISKRNLKELASHYLSSEGNKLTDFIRIQDEKKRDKLKMNSNQEVIKKPEYAVRQKEVYNTLYKEFAKNYTENVTRSQTRCKGNLELLGKAVPNQQRTLLCTPLIDNPKQAETVLQRPKYRPSPFKSKLSMVPSQHNPLLLDEQKKSNGQQFPSQSKLEENQLTHINDTFKRINQYLQVTIRYKEAINPQQLSELKNVSKQLGIKLTNAELQSSFLKSKDFISMSRSKLAQVLNKALIPFQLTIHKENINRKVPTFKFWVELSGNNHMLVKSMLKRRNWLTYNSEFDPNESQCLDNSGSYEEIKNNSSGTQTTVIWTQMRRIKIVNELTYSQIYNHVDGINCIATKTGLFNNLKQFYEKQSKNVFEYVPETYIIDLQASSSTSVISRLCEQYLNHKQYWIIKPGEGTNRGHGIRLVECINKVQELIQKEYNSYKTVIVQKYIMNPYLIHKRKFDIRVFCLLTYYGETGTLRGYYYNEGYLRTSCKEFSLSKVESKYVHLTNDAIQKNSQDYGKFESGNKLSYDDFNKLLLRDKDVSFNDIILPKIRDSCRDVIESAQHKLIGEIRKDYNGFELLGLDFMIDSDLKLELIEVNTNPCLETQSCMLLSRLIPQMLDQTFKIAIDPFLKPTEQQYLMNQDLSLSEFKYELIFESKIPQ